MSEYWQKIAHENANNFAKEKSEDFSEMFLKESGLETPVDEVHLQKVLGKYLALTYAMGYLDGIEKLKTTKLYVPGAKS